MSTFITFITANWASLVGILTAAAGIFALIAKLTPSPKDDGIAAAILKFLNLVPQASPVADEKDEDKPTPVL